MASSWFKDVSRKTRSGTSSRNMFTPGNTTSVIFSKGLLNTPGDNNCFLNSAVQVLWHLDVFRRSFREMKGHACMGTACIFCALKDLFSQLRNSEEEVLLPDALRKALASAFKDQRRFQLGCMDDAAECFENILVRIHFHLAHNIKEDLCDAKHCVPHRKFAMTLIEHSVCKCGATSEPFPFTQMVHYVSSAALCAEAQKMRNDRMWPNTDHFGVLLRKAGAIGDVRECPSACGQKIKIRRVLMNCPDVVSIGLIWDSDKPDIKHISDVICNLGTAIQLRELFDDTLDDRAKANSLFLVGIVTYYGRHYTTFFYNTNLRYWVYFDDAMVKQVGPNWSDVVDRCRRGHFQPLLLLYAYPDGKTVSSATAPKGITLLKGYDKDDKENEVPSVHPNKAPESLSSKVSELLSEREAPIPVNHYHGNSNSSTTSTVSYSGQSVSSNDSQSTLVYKPVGGVPEFQAASEQKQSPPKEDDERGARKPTNDWKINEDGSEANAIRGTWIDSVVEIGQDALSYVPMKKASGGSYAISQFALQGHDEEDSGLGSHQRTIPQLHTDYIKEGHSSRTSSEVVNGRTPGTRSHTAPLQNGRPSSAKETPASQGVRVPMSPQQIKRPSSAHTLGRNKAVSQIPVNIVSSSKQVQQGRADPVATRDGAMYNAKTGIITGHNVRQTPVHISNPKPSLTFEPYSNFATEVESDPDPQRSRKMDIKPLQEFNERQRPQESPRDSSAVGQQASRAPVVRQGSWSNGSSGQFAGDFSGKNPSVQRTSSLTMKPLEKFQDSHSSVPDLKDATSQGRGYNASIANGQYPKYSSVPDLQQQMGFVDANQGRKHSSSDPLQTARTMKRSLSSDQPIAPGGILAEAIRNKDPTPAPKVQQQEQEQHHIPLMRSSSIHQNTEEKQARAKYNIQNGFLTLPGKKQMNQFRASSKYSGDGGKGNIGDSGGIGYGSASVLHRDVPRLTRQHSNESKSSVTSYQHQDGFMMRQTPEVSVTHGLDIDSIASRDSGYRSRDRSSASSGSVYSLDGPTSECSPVTPNTVGNPEDGSSSPSPYGHIHQASGRNQHLAPNQNVSKESAPRSQTPTKQLPKQRSPTPNELSGIAIRGQEDVAIDMVKGAEEQLLSSKKAEEDEDLAMALGFCTAAASTLKIALRLEDIKDQTRLFLQTKYNTTVQRSRGLHRRLTLLRRSDEGVSRSRSTPPPPPKPDYPASTAPQPPKADYPRAPVLQRRDSTEEMRRQEKESLQQIELLKKRVDDLYSHQDAARDSRPYGNQQSYGNQRSNGHQQSGAANQADTASISSRSGYRPQQYQSVPSSPSMHRSRVATSQPMHGAAPSVNTSTVHSAPSERQGQSRGHQGYAGSNGWVSTSQQQQSTAPLVKSSIPQGATQGQSVGSVGYQKSSTAPLHKDWDQTQIGYGSGSRTMGRSATPLSFSSTTHQAKPIDPRYRSQTPTPYFGTSKPSYSSYTQSGIAGNRNNNAVTQQAPSSVTGGHTNRTDGQYQRSGADVQQRNYNMDWVQRSEQPRPENVISGKATMSDTTTCIKSDGTLPKPRGVNQGQGSQRKKLADNLIDLY